MPEHAGEGWSFKVAPPRLGGGHPAIETFDVAIADRNLAHSALREHLRPGPDTTITNADPLTAEAVSRLGLRPGQVKLRR
jgi:hypothetical protein